MTLTGVSVFVVRGLLERQERGTIDESETDNTPTTTTVQRRYFTRDWKLRGCLLSSGLCVKGETDLGVHGSHPMQSWCHSASARLRSAHAPAINRP